MHNLPDYNCSPSMHILQDNLPYLFSTSETICFTMYFQAKEAFFCDWLKWCEFRCFTQWSTWAIPLFSIYCLLFKYTSTEKIAKIIDQVKVLNFQKSNIVKICGLYNSLKQVIIIDNSYNFIDNTKKNCLYGLFNLRHINLQWNLIINIAKKSFNNLSNLEDINLSNNPIAFISSNLFTIPVKG